MPNWIKSPLLYQLSYQPKLSGPLEKVVPAGPPKLSSVPPVYPITASGHSTNVGPRLPAVTYGRDSLAADWAVLTTFDAADCCLGGDE